MLFKNKELEHRVINLEAGVLALKDKYDKLLSNYEKTVVELHKELGGTTYLRFTTYLSDRPSSDSFEAGQITTKQKLDMLFDKIGCQPVKTTPEIKLECKNPKKRGCENK